MEDNSIFMTQYDDNINNITFTNVIDTLPEGHTEIKDKNWKHYDKIKWRWRFLKFYNKSVVEISYKYPSDTKRYYFSKSGNWVHRDIPKEYNQFIVKKIYYYAIN
jgi:hypothetical protein